jgi:hypothetical protein
LISLPLRFASSNFAFFAAAFALSSSALLFCSSTAGSIASSARDPAAASRASLRLFASCEHQKIFRLEIRGRRRDTVDAAKGPEDCLKYLVKRNAPDAVHSPSFSSKVAKFRV